METQSHQNYEQIIGTMFYPLPLATHKLSNLNEATNQIKNRKNAQALYFNASHKLRILLQYNLTILNFLFGSPDQQ